MIKSKFTIQAFSITETVVSLVVTSIIVSLIFVIFNILSEQMHDFKKQNESIADLNRLSYVLTKDIFECENMHPAEKQIDFFSNSKGNINYVFAEEYIIRNQKEYTDTFKLKESRFKIDTLKNTNLKKVFSRIQMETTVNEQLVGLNFFRKVYANELIQQKLLHEH